MRLKLPIPIFAILLAIIAFFVIMPAVSGTTQSDDQAIALTAAQEQGTPMVQTADTTNRTPAIYTGGGNAVHAIAPRDHQVATPSMSSTDFRGSTAHQPTRAPNNVTMAPTDHLKAGRFTSSG